MKIFPNSICKFKYAWFIMWSLLVALSGEVKSQSVSIYKEKTSWDSVVIQHGFEPKGAFAYVEGKPSLPDVLLIGNSISIGYTNNVRAYLKGQANVYRIPQNGGHTGTMLEKQEEWLQKKKWDIIHFNFGLHDLKYTKNGTLNLEGKRVICLDDYKENLKKMIPILQNSLTETGKLIFATTSVIPEGARGRVKGDEVIYNNAAIEIISAFDGILIDDQYKLTSSFPNEQRQKNVHFFPEGKERQGRQVAASILRALKYPGQRIQLRSPDDILKAEIYRGSSGQLMVKLDKNGQAVMLPSPLGISINAGKTKFKPVILSGKSYVIDEKYPWYGNHSSVSNRCNGIILPVSTGWDLEVRLYNDGLAFRYNYFTKDTVLFSGEFTQLHFDASLNAKYMRYRLAEESRIYTGLVTEIGKSKKNRTMPPLLLYPDNQHSYYMILEGGGFDFHGYALLPEIKTSNGQKTCSFSVDYAEKPNGWETHGQAHTGWKIISVTSTLDELFNTDIVHNVCPPPDSVLYPYGLREPWIKPGTSTWNWWSRVSVDFDKQLELVDLAAKMGADYHLVDIGWDIKWNDDHSGAYEYLHQLCDYAAKKGIGIFVWKTSDVSFNMSMMQDEPNNKFLKLKGHDIPLDTSLMRMEVEKIAQTGAKGIKLDYIQSENATWKKYMENFLKVCAQNKLMVNFHGCPIPAGESRTYPNEITREAIWGGEKLRGGGGEAKMPVSHYIDQLFTRYIAGHADFTPGIFDPEKGRGYTHAMQLASAMLFTSPLLVWADHPENYMASEGLEIIQSIPTVWDETIVLEQSNLSDLALFARRSGRDWYIAGINGIPDQNQNVLIDLNFLGDRHYEALICKDDIVGRSGVILKEKEIVSWYDKLNIAMLPGGGFIVRFIPK